MMKSLNPLHSSLFKQTMKNYWHGLYTAITDLSPHLLLISVPGFERYHLPNKPDYWNPAFSIVGLVRTVGLKVEFGSSDFKTVFLKHVSLYLIEDNSNKVSSTKQLVEALLNKKLSRVYPMIVSELPAEGAAMLRNVLTTYSPVIGEAFLSSSEVDGAVIHGPVRVPGGSITPELIDLTALSFFQSHYDLKSAI